MIQPVPWYRDESMVQKSSDDFSSMFRLVRSGTLPATYQRKQQLNFLIPRINVYETCPIINPPLKRRIRYFSFDNQPNLKR